MFSPQDGVCGNDFIDLDWGYSTEINNNNLTTDVRISHKLFLLESHNKETDYSLNCEIQVCDRNNGTSDCNLLAGCLDQSGILYPTAQHSTAEKVLCCVMCCI